MPLTLSLTADAGFEIRTPHSFKVRITNVGLNTYVQTPNIVSHLDIPPAVSVLGTTIDLTPLHALLEPVNAGLGAAQGLLQQAVSPHFNVEPSDLTSLYMMTTYLDGSLRISRDDTGRVFIMLKDISLYGAP